MPKSHLLPPPALLDFLAPYDHDVQQLALAVRRFVIEHIPHMTEIVYDAPTAVAIAFTPSGRFKEAICHVSVYADHVNLGFNRGADLPDPGRLLQGSGKTIRHLTVRRVEDLLAPPLRVLLAEAVKRAHATTAHAGVIIKSTPGKKRRPLASIKARPRLAKSAD